MADDIKDAPNRVDGVLKVTGKAMYALKKRNPKV
jgi:hypothetical protein